MARINNVVSFYLFKGNFPGLVVLSGQMYGLRVCVCLCTKAGWHTDLIFPFAKELLFHGRRRYYPVIAIVFGAIYPY